MTATLTALRDHLVGNISHVEPLHHMLQRCILRIVTWMASANLSTIVASWSALGAALAAMEAVHLQ